MIETYISHSKEDTQKLGAQMAQAALAKLAASNSGALVLALEGDLGAGKTTFTQGFLTALQAPGPYTSPTFVVMKKYSTPLLKTGALYHIDAYRIQSADLASLGWEEILAGKNLVLVEWSERVRALLPRDSWRFHFHWQSETQREISWEK